MNSIKTKLKVVTICVLLLSFMLMAVPLLVLFEKYYTMQEKDFLLSTYIDIGREFSSVEELINYINVYELRDNLNFTVATENEYIYSTSRWYKSDGENLYLHQDTSVRNTLTSSFMWEENSLKNKNYIINKVSEASTQISFLHLLTTIKINDVEYFFIIEKSFANLQQNIRSLVMFMITCMIPILAISVVLINTVSNYFINPILEIVTKTKKISDFHFEDKIIVRTTDEIGILGESINKVSEELETKLKILDEQAINLKKDIEKKENDEKVMKEFISNVSHELKTPITMIMGYAEALKSNINNTKKDDYCEIIIKESENLNEMVKTLIDVAKIQSNANDLQKTNFNLIEIIESLYSRYLLLMSENNINFKKEANNNLIIINADRNKLEMAISNYLNNSIKYIGKEQEVVLSVIDNENTITINVFNSGNNLPESKIERLWDSFYKLDEARSRDNGGTGLGLYIVKTICIAHNFKFGAYNKNNGIMFYIEINKNT